MPLRANRRLCRIRVKNERLTDGVPAQAVVELSHGKEKVYGSIP
jgi:hypothetical protein